MKLDCYKTLDFFKVYNHFCQPWQPDFSCNDDCIFFEWCVKDMYTEEAIKAAQEYADKHMTEEE